MNSSISSSVCLPCTKVGTVLHLISSYRPISLLPACSKLLERCVVEHLTSHLHSNNQIQSSIGFRPQHSIQTLLLHCTAGIYLVSDRKQLVCIVFLDISKAFDSVILSMTFSLPNSLSWPVFLYHSWFWFIFIIDHR